MPDNSNGNGNGNGHGDACGCGYMHMKHATMSSDDAIDEATFLSLGGAELRRASEVLDDTSHALRQRYLVTGPARSIPPTS